MVINYNAKIYRIRELIKLSEKEIKMIKGIGDRSVNEIKAKLDVVYHGGIGE